MVVTAISTLFSKFLFVTFKINRKIGAFFWYQKLISMDESKSDRTDRVIHLWQISHKHDAISNVYQISHIVHLFTYRPDLFFNKRVKVLLKKISHSWILYKVCVLSQGIIAHSAWWVSLISPKWHIHIDSSVLLLPVQMLGAFRMVELRFNIFDN